jgi:plasmid stabilization system protein ParE
MHAPSGGFKNYLIFYLPAANEIEVVRVLHGARNLRKALRETPG